ncbi:NAD(P)/FAD-dependent oxidoreductase [Sinorhizobium medicae]|uniref:NAD(P)/FAD-dependent oxidoreductase n=1 Tax=Sinorhizobium medicae TaxID=110321 RepID=UPI001F1CCCFD|nr:FAD-dependent oxidoreductase [Sinorhizobium medicae]
MNARHARVLIVGGGPAGYTAAIYAACANLKPLLVTGRQAGGKLTTMAYVENFPGFAEPVKGLLLMEQMRQQAENVGTKVMYDIITSVDLSMRPFHLEGDSGDTYLADAIIIATGAQARWLGLPSEKKFEGFGVSASAIFDGVFCRNKEVVIVGGGNSAVQAALHLSNLASKVTVVHRRDRFRAESILKDRLLSRPNLDVIWNHVIDEVIGEHEPSKWVRLALRPDTLVQIDQSSSLTTCGRASHTFFGLPAISRASFRISLSIVFLPNSRCNSFTCA